MANLTRTLEPELGKASETFRVILVNGQRQVGKSTILQNLAKGTKRAYVSLDDTRLRRLAQEDPYLFLQQMPPPIIIDEVQYAPELFPCIKIYVDEHQNEKGAFWLT
ncbi:MAG: AAA family ATPase, partial [Fibromonadales bacterium]|nr:AAA family ATPase [Fibromonadales bacterium]